MEWFLEVWLIHFTGSATSPVERSVPPRARAGCPFDRLRAGSHNSQRDAGATLDDVSGFAANFGPPPADTYKQEPPIVEKFRFFAFEGMADELQNPS
jgi:hypothetical protein